jgi:hypothetical protein
MACAKPSVQAQHQKTKTKNRTTPEKLVHLNKAKMLMCCQFTTNPTIPGPGMICHHL